MYGLLTIFKKDNFPFAQFVNFREQKIEPELTYVKIT